MKLEVHKSQLHKALSELVTAKRPAHLILSGALFKAADSVLTLVGTDLDNTVTLTLPVSVITPGSIVTPVKPLAAAVKDMDGLLTLEVTGDELIVTDGLSEVKLATFPAEDFPLAPHDGPEVGTLSDSDLDAIQKKLTPMAATYDPSSVMGGVHLAAKNGTVNGVATDGSRLSHLPLPANGEYNVIVPVAAMKVLAKLSKNKEHRGTVKLHVFSNILTIKMSGAEVAMRLIEGQYPAYAELFPLTDKTRVKLEIAPLLKLVIAASKHVDERSNVLRVVVGPTLTIKAVNPDSSGYTGGMKLGPDAADVNMTLGLNAKFLKDALESATGKVVHLDLRGPLKPLVFLDDSPGKHLLMPVQIKEAA